MAYTWGYVKENALSKLNIEEEEANQLGFLSRFPYAANEAMTQICSAKPKHNFFVINVIDRNKAWKIMTAAHQIYLDRGYFEEILDESMVDYSIKERFWKEWNKLYFKDIPITMPDDFISFNDDVAEYCDGEAYDDVLEYYGDNQIICKEESFYRIPYNSRWFFFTKDLPNSTIITAPADIVDAIPSYIANQCFKLDDEQRATIYRNEFEAFIARLDETNFKRQRTFNVGGNW